MKLSDRFFELLASVRNLIGDTEHSPYDPVPGIRQELESKGYRFTDPPLITLMGTRGLRSYIVTAREGQQVDYYRGNDPASLQYRRDYDDSLNRYKSGLSAVPQADIGMPK